MSDFAAARLKHRSDYARLHDIYSSNSRSAQQWQNFPTKAQQRPASATHRAMPPACGSRAETARSSSRARAPCVSSRVSQVRSASRASATSRISAPQNIQRASSTPRRRVERRPNSARNNRKISVNKKHRELTTEHTLSPSPPPPPPPPPPPLPTVDNGIWLGGFWKESSPEHQVPHSCAAGLVSSVLAAAVD